MDSQPNSSPPDPASEAPDLSLVSCFHLIQELATRFPECFAVMFEKADEGNEPVMYREFVGNNSRIEGMLGRAYRQAKRANNRTDREAYGI